MMEPTAVGNEDDDDVDTPMEEGEIDDTDVTGDSVDNGGDDDGAVEAAEADDNNNDDAGDDVAGDEEDEDAASDEMMDKDFGEETGDVAEEDDESGSKSDSPPTADGTNDVVVDGGDETTPDGETPSDDAASAKADVEDLNNSKSESVDSDDNNKADVANDDDKMDVDGDPSEGETGGGNETAEDSAKELPYSTRGRSTVGSTAGSGGEERSSSTVGIEPVAHTLEELSRPKEAGASFLVETMTEEERRTRTRYIPDVEGMHVLRKAEVKDDIAFARSLPSTVSAQGSIQLRTGRLAASSGRRRGDMDLDDAAASFNDGGSTTIELTHNEVTVPSDVFVSPEGVSVGDNEGTVVVKETESSKAKANAPSHIETTVAFNPPRPPESIGDKKKHRVLRWERRPDDIELDMKNYRRTVQRTRQELHKSEAELNRLETVDAHLRRHFLNNLDLLGEESDQLRDCVQSEIQKLSKFTGLAGSRTRNRNAAKPGVVMRDVLSVLQKGDMSEVAAVDDSIVTEMAALGSASADISKAGIGGLSPASFVDWDRSTIIKKSAPAMAWLEPGQAVKTPDGDGIVVEVLPVEIPKDDSSEEKKEKDQKVVQAGEAVDEKKGQLSAVKKKPDATEAAAKEEEEKKAAREKEHDKVKSLEPPRVKVRIADNVSVFNLDAITIADNPAHYSDKKLAKRWKGMIKSALQVGSCIDMEGLSSAASASSTSETDMNVEGNNGGSGSGDNGGSGSSNGLPAADQEDTFLPVNASLIPTIAGRGNLLQSMKILDIENELHDALFDGHGVLGRKSNPGVTSDVRRWEEDEQEYLTLRASALQLRNLLYRQRRIRMLNERTSTSMTDRYHKAETAVADMRTDLKNLKRKLEGELSDLGISEGMVNKILSKFYKGQTEDDKGDATTPKRLKRASSMIRESMVLSALPGVDKLSDDDDQGTDDLSGDDMDAVQPPTKKLRSG